LTINCGFGEFRNDVAKEKGADRARHGNAQQRPRRKPPPHRLPLRHVFKLLGSAEFGAAPARSCSDITRRCIGDGRVRSGATGINPLVDRPAVLFDVDGTLTDTNYLHTLAWWRALRDAGHEIAMASVHPLI